MIISHSHVRTTSQFSVTGLFCIFLYNNNNNNNNGEHQLRSNEGAQQGDTLGSLEFC